MITVAAAYAFLTATNVIPAATANLISNHEMTLLPFLAGVISVFVARRHGGRYRLGWILLAAWGFLSAVGNAIWEWYELVIHVEVPFPSIADVGYLAGTCCAIAAIAAFAVTSKGVSKSRTVLDAILIAGSTFVVSWAIFMDELHQSSTGSLLEQAIGLAYPVLDIVIVALVVFVAYRSSSSGRVPLMIIGLGFLGWAISDTAFAFLTLKNVYYTGYPTDAGWFAGDMLLVLASFKALRSDVTVTQREERATARWRVYLPYAIAGLALLVAASDQIADEKLDPVVLPGIMLLLVVVVARQFLMVVENQSTTIARMRSVDEMKNGILNAVSHELRTPLTVIKGMSQLLEEDDDLTDAQRALVDSVLRNSIRLDGLLGALLDLGRLTRGVLEPTRHPTQMTDLLVRVADDVRADTHMIRVGGTPVVANVDAAQVERIVENLFVNAMRHTPAGTNVSATVSRTPEGVLISVDDDGPGVADEIRERIFEPFVQSPEAVDFSRGTGIGLSLVAKFAELHGGRAWVENGDDGGARFRVLLGEDARDDGVLVGAGRS